MMSSPLLDRSNSSISGTRKRKLRKTPSSTWREKIAARKESVKEEIENALGHKMKRSGGRTVETRMSRKREKVISEIFCTEKTYQQQLKIVIKQFMIPMQKLGLLPDPDHRMIFENIKSIQAVNQELLMHMEEIGIAQAFIQLAPFLKVYCTYANNFERSMQTLQDCERKRADFGQFLRQQESKPEACCLNLHSLLITPIQRIPRYRLLLQELLDNTPINHQDYTHLQEAVTSINHVTSGINEYIREHENFQKMLIIQNSLTGPNAPRILAPGRRFLKEGLLMKVSNKGNGSNPRMFFLFNDMLVYAKPNLLDHTNTARTYLSRRIVCLDRCEVQLVLGEQTVEQSGALFKIIFDGDSLLLYSTDQSIALAWIDALQGAIQQLKENRVALRRTENTSNRLSSSSRGRVKPSRRSSILRSNVILRNKRQYPEDEIPDAKIPKDSLYPMRKQISRRKRATPGCTPPAKRKSTGKRKSRRLQRGPFSLERTRKEENVTPSSSSQVESDIPDHPSTINHNETRDKSTTTDIHIPPTIPLFDVVETGSDDSESSSLDGQQGTPPFCNIL